MVDSVHKIQGDVRRIQPSEDDTEQRHAQHEEQTPDEGEGDGFSPAKNFTKWTGEESSGIHRAPSLWEAKPHVQNHQDSPATEHLPSRSTTEQDFEEELTERVPRHNQRFPRLQALGLIDAQGHWHWGLLSFLVLTLFSVLLTSMLILSVLL